MSFWGKRISSTAAGDANVLVASGTASTEQGARQASERAMPRRYSSGLCSSFCYVVWIAACVIVSERKFLVFRRLYHKSIDNEDRCILLNAHVE